VTSYDDDDRIVYTVRLSVRPSVCQRRLGLHNTTLVAVYCITGISGCGENVSFVCNVIEAVTFCQLIERRN